MKIKNKLKYYRVHALMTIHDLSKESRVSPGAILKIENNTEMKRGHHPRTLVKLVNALQTRLKDLSIKDVFPYFDRLVG